MCLFVVVWFWRNWGGNFLDSLLRSMWIFFFWNNEFGFLLGFFNDLVFLLLLFLVVKEKVKNNN